MSLLIIGFQYPGQRSLIKRAPPMNLCQDQLIFPEQTYDGQRLKPDLQAVLQMIVDMIFTLGVNVNRFLVGVSHRAAMRLQPSQEHLKTRFIQPRSLKRNIQNHLINQSLHWLHWLPTVLAPRKYPAKKKQSTHTKYQGYAEAAY